MPAATAVSLPHNHCNCSASLGLATFYLLQIILSTSGKLISVPVAGNQPGTALVHYHSSYLNTLLMGIMKSGLLFWSAAAVAVPAPHLTAAVSSQLPYRRPTAQYPQYPPVCLARRLAARYPPPHTRAREPHCLGRNGEVSQTRDRSMTLALVTYVCCMNEHLPYIMHLLIVRACLLIICNLVDGCIFRKIIHVCIFSSAQQIKC